MIAFYIALGLVALPFVWPHRWLYREGQAYLLRWPLLGGDGLKRAPWPIGRQGTNLFLHYLCKSDGPSVHSHPWDARALILWGRYADTRRKETPYGFTTPVTTVHGPFSINKIPGGAYHTLQLLTPFVITLCWTTAKHGHGWFFLVNGRKVGASGKGAHVYDEAQREGHA